MSLVLFTILIFGCDCFLLKISTSPAVETNLGNPGSSILALINLLADETKQRMELEQYVKKLHEEVEAIRNESKKSEILHQQDINSHNILQKEMSRMKNIILQLKEHLKRPENIDQDQMGLMLFINRTKLLETKIADLESRVKRLESNEQNCKCSGTKASATTAPSCSGTTQPVSSGSGGGQNTDSCQPFNASLCKMSCIAIDSRGCLICNCPRITAAPSGESGYSGGCPSFDANGCDISCIVMDNQDCLHCKCRVTIPRAVYFTQNPATTPFPPITADSNLCPPLRCVAPCNVGITFGQDNCPICKCTN